VASTATKDEVRTAYRRLHRRVEPAAGGTLGLAHLVSVAYRSTLDGGRSARAADVDPYAVLGVRPETPPDEVRGAFRRLAQLVHPDRGGTDELFHIVDMSYDLVTDPLARAERRTGVKYRPPPRPPPPGPFHPRAAEDRRYEPVWRSWLAIGGGVGVLLFGATVLVAFLVAMSSVAAPQLAPLVLLMTFGAGMAARPAYAAIARGVTQLRTRHAFAASAELDSFLFERCLDAPVGRERDDILYYAYRNWCREHRCPTLSMRAFIEYLRSLGLLYVTASSWDAGVVVGVRLRDD
jgi:hypothetical protein